MTDQAEHDTSDGGTATATRTAPPRVDRLPPWQVLLHNDDVNDMIYVVGRVQLFAEHTGTNGSPDGLSGEAAPGRGRNRH